MTARQADRLRAVTEQAFPEAMVRGHERLIGAKRNDEKDRHVAAAAVKAKAEVIATSNVRDFLHLPPGSEAMRPDEFLVALFGAESEAILRVLREQAADLRRPPATADDRRGPTCEVGARRSQVRRAGQGEVGLILTEVRAAAPPGARPAAHESR